jgi:hypothetical protein
MTMTTDYEIIRVDATDQNAGIAGYYAVDRNFTDAGAADLVFRDAGSGPEVTNDGVFGPFATEAAAEAWIDSDDD